jgi:hypothetical protein
MATPTDLPTSSEDATLADIVVLDGLRTTTVERWRALINDLARHGVAVFLVSSEGVRLHEGDSQDIMKLEHFVPSWVMDEYLAACQSDAFWGTCFEYFQNASQNDDIKVRAELLRAKYEIAGQSARFMFRKHDILLKKMISSLALALGGIGSLETAVRSDRSVGAVNSLIARTCIDANGETLHVLAVLPVAGDLTVAAVGFADLRPLDEEVDMNESSPRLISTYATEQVIKNIPTSVERLRNLATALSNKAIEGYAVQEQLKKALTELRTLGPVSMCKSTIHLCPSLLEPLFLVTHVILNISLSRGCFRTHGSLWQDAREPSMQYTWFRTPTFDSFKPQRVDHTRSTWTSLTPCSGGFSATSKFPGHTSNSW